MLPDASLGVNSFNWIRERHSEVASLFGFDVERRHQPQGLAYIKVGGQRGSMGSVQSARDGRETPTVFRRSPVEVLYTMVPTHPKNRLKRKAKKSATRLKNVMVAEVHHKQHTAANTPPKDDSRETLKVQFDENWHDSLGTSRTAHSSNTLRMAAFQRKRVEELGQPEFCFDQNELPYWWARLEGGDDWKTRGAVVEQGFAFSSCRTALAGSTITVSCSC